MTLATEGLLSHLSAGNSTTCRAWLLRRSDGVEHSYTDHDEVLQFESLTFRPSDGLSAKSLNSSLGLSIDNSEVVGTITFEGLDHLDIQGGLYKNCFVKVWLVNWSNVDERMISFAGTIGSINYDGVQFRAELHSLSEQLNKKVGRLIQRSCSAAFGDTKCKLNSRSNEFFSLGTVSQVSSDGVSVILEGSHHRKGWFRGGTLYQRDGYGFQKGLTILNDRGDGSLRELRLLYPKNLPLVVGSPIECVVGCDKTRKMCSQRFDNIVNFRGFPHVPGDDWVLSSA